MKNVQMISKLLIFKIRINELEDQIEKMKKENNDLSKQIKNLKNVQIYQSKELETCTKGKKHPSKLNIYGGEVKNLIAKKHEYFNKINGNKKSLTNMKNYLVKIIKIYNEMISSNKINKADPIIKTIEETIDSLQRELSGSEEEIIERINNWDMTEMIQEKNSVQSYRKILRNPTNSSPGRNGLPDINKYNKNRNMNASQSPTNYKGVFNKYEYLSSKEKLNIPFSYVYKNKNRNSVNFEKSSSPKRMNNNNEEENKDIQDRERDHSSGDSNIENEDLDFIVMDYEQTTELDYANLVKKKDTLVKINSKLEKNLKEVDKLYEKKFKDLTNTIEHNTKKLKILQQVCLN